MDGGSQPRRRGLAKQGLRALKACGDGFWELDLQEGSAWFSEWFYRKLGWTPGSRRTTLAELEPHFERAVWMSLMGAFRAHLEQGRPLDVSVEVCVPPGGRERWRIRGSAHRNDAGQPVSLAGSMSDADAAAGAAPELLGIAGAFEALPVAAALLDGRALLIQANRQWQSLPAVTTAHALARLRAANSQTAIEFWLDQGEGVEAGARHLRVRVVAFQHGGARHLAVTLEDRRSD